MSTNKLIVKYDKSVEICFYVGRNKWSNYKYIWLFNEKPDAMCNNLIVDLFTAEQLPVCKCNSP